MTKETSEKVVKLSDKIRRVEIFITWIERALADLENMHDRKISLSPDITDYARHNINLTDQETREFLAEVLNNRNNDYYSKTNI